MSINASVNALREDLGNIKRDLAGLTTELGSLAQTGSQEAKNHLLARIAVLQSQALFLQDRIRYTLANGVGYLEEKVREKPYHTAIFAVLVSGLVAWIIMRPRD